MNKIGENVHLLRKRMRLTQTDFSKQIGISQGTLSDIEQGHCNPSVETVLSIHEQYGVSLDLILKGSEDDQSAKLHLKDRRNDEEELTFLKVRLKFCFFKWIEWSLVRPIPKYLARSLGGSKNESSSERTLLEAQNRLEQ